MILFGKFRKTRQAIKTKDQLDEEYWQKRWEDGLKGKHIVKRYLVCFGEGHYKDFCGVKEITGYYDKNFDNVDVFYQIDFDDSRTMHIYMPERCFMFKQEAQKAYNTFVDQHMAPLQLRIQALEAARVQEN
jgi:hypothetical protein